MLNKILISPFQKFVRIESFGGILLMVATLVAIIWANSPLGIHYKELWDFRLGMTSETLSLNKPLILWVNDGLMAIFFFLIGLEIKRELLIGELNSFRKAAFPLIAAIGGMLFPMGLFLFLNQNPETVNGWGVPMATDIAFTLAILKLLGDRVPISLKVFLTAFAIVDDIGAVLVIALFYSAGIKWGLLTAAFAIFGILMILSYRGVYFKFLSLFAGIVVWYLFLKAGIHPTVAGVLMAFTIPIGRKLDVNTYAEKLSDIASDFKSCCDQNKQILTREQIDRIDDLEDWTGKVQSPLQHLEHKLHNWVAYLIMPVFALANAGVIFNSGIEMEGALISNTALSLIFGKTVGITLLAFLGVKLGIAELPSDISYMQVLGVALLAGVGFTMSIFIANLAFPGNPLYVDSTKMGILIGSFISGLGGFIILRLFSQKPVR